MKKISNLPPPEFDGRDMEVAGAIKMLVTVAGQERAEVERAIQTRQEYNRAGVAQVPSWAQEEIRKLDPWLRFRWDFIEERYAVERYVEADRYYIHLLWFRWKMDRSTVEQCRELLIQCDMQRWPSPEAYLAHQRAKAKAIRDANESTSTDAVLAAVDELPRENIKNFIQVERAIQTGERIVPLGEDARKLEKMSQATTHAPAENASMNPGMNPRIYQRKKGPRNE